MQLNHEDRANLNKAILSVQHSRTWQWMNSVVFSKLSSKSANERLLRYQFRNENLSIYACIYILMVCYIPSPHETRNRAPLYSHKGENFPSFLQICRTHFKPRRLELALLQSTTFEKPGEVGTIRTNYKPDRARGGEGSCRAGPGPLKETHAYLCSCSYHVVFTMRFVRYHAALIFFLLRPGPTHVPCRGLCLRKKTY